MWMRSAKIWCLMPPRQLLLRRLLPSLILSKVLSLRKLKLELRLRLRTEILPSRKPSLQMLHLLRLNSQWLLLWDPSLEQLLSRNLSSQQSLLRMLSLEWPPQWLLTQLLTLTRSAREMLMMSESINNNHPQPQINSVMHVLQ
ncbi:hypothetical protein K449DRAFT_257429 [Hypoxylon sp. EC38]|nr:hypothetical protein K449DRAFT_257429 [Hypoxylon sp. EC38]